MANTIKIKNSGTSSNVPSSLEHGELAINYADGLLFYKNSSNVISQFSSGGGASVTISDTAPSSPSAGDLWYESDTGDFFVYYDGYWVELGADPPSSSFLSDLDGDTLIQVEESNDEDKIRFDTAGSERMIIDASGNVGIGTTSPTNTLHVDSGSTAQYAAPQVYVAPSGHASSDRAAIQLDDIQLLTDINGDGTEDFSIYSNNAAAHRLSIDGSGNVGIGTTSPASALEIADGSAGQLRFEPTPLAIGSNNDGYELNLVGGTPDSYTNAGGRIRLGGGTRGDGDIDSVIFMRDSTESMRIDSSGNVGIGTTSPVDMFDVGNASNNGSFRVHASQGAESFRVSGDVVRSSSIVNLTTASAANVFINASNNSIYRSTSSGKYKTDIETLDVEHADKIFDLRPVWYRSTTGNDPAEYSYYGLIAEEVAAVDPRLVHFGAGANCECVEDEEGHIEHEQSCLTEPEGVFYERFVPHLISVVQRQKAQIDVLTARIETLEAG